MLNRDDLMEYIERPCILVSSIEEELQRLEELYQLNLIHTPREASFDRITDIVSHMFGMPICLISLVTESEQWFKSCIGLPDDLNESRSTEREAAFCQHVVANKHYLVVENALQDERFVHNRLVHDYGIRFYAGVPLMTKKNNILGTLCIIDGVPRQFDEEKVNLLKKMAELVMTEIELRDLIEKKTEKDERISELLNQTRWLTKAINSTSTGVTITDPKQLGNPIIFCNAGFTKITQYEPEEVLGRNCKFLQGVETDAKSIEAIRQAIREQTDLKSELKNYRKDGTEFWNELTLSPVFSDDGELVHYVGIQNDVTSRKNAEEYLMQAFFEQENLMHSVPDIIYMLDLRGRLMKWNKQVEIHSRYTEDELWMAKAFMFIVEEDADMLHQAHAKLLVTGKTEIEAMFKTKDGVRVPYHWSAVMIKDEEGQPIGIAGVGKNISERVQIQQDLMLASKLQASLLPSDVVHSLIEVRSIFQPDNFVSGDSFEYIWRTENCLYIYVIDLMGHGIATALNVNAVKMLFNQALMKGERSLAEKMSQINQACVSLFHKENSFVAAMCVEFNLVTNQLTLVSGGINKFFVKSSERSGLVKVPGPLLGLFDETHFEEHVIDIHSGDEFFIMSDGLYDLFNETQAEELSSYNQMYDYLKSLALSEACTDDATAVCVQIK